MQIGKIIFTKSHFRKIPDVLWIILISLLASNSCLSQEITTSTLLSGLQKKSRQLPYLANQEYLRNHNMSMPLFDAVEFRTETDEFNIGEQEYSLRFKFNDRQERKVYNSYINAISAKYTILQQELINERIEDGYEYMLEIYSSQKKLAFTLEQIAVFKDKRRVYQRMMEALEDIDIASYISNDEKIIDLVTDSLQYSEEIKLALYHFSLSGENSIEKLNVDNWISIEKVEQIINGDLASVSVPIDPETRLDYNTSVAEYNLEVAQGNKWFEFAQLRYQADDDINFQREITLGASFRLPLASNNRTRINETALEVLENKYKIQEEEFNRTISIADTKRQINAKINEWYLLKRLSSDQKWEETLQSLSKNPNVAPIELLSIKLVILEQKESIFDIEEDIYDLYLQFLKDTNLLNLENNINYISNNLNQY